jgi:energy-coupling factor transport system permease protein
MSITELPRWLHPGAWWVWALGLAAAASRTTNPLLLGLIITVASLVVAARRSDAPWARSFGFFVKLGIVIIVLRLVFQVLFGTSFGTTVVLALPAIPLPEWFAGVQLGGAVTLESLLIAFTDGLRLATIIICIGAANALASPTRLLKSVPAVLYEFGVSVVVALTFTPQLVADVNRVQTTRRLRGRRTRGPRAIAGAAMPVLEGALQRSVLLAAAMDSRGYGRRAGAHRQTRAAALLLGGMVAAVIGVFGFVSAGAPTWLGLPMLLAGLVACGIALALASRGHGRSQYRPDPWRGSEWAVAGSGLVAALGFWLAAALDPSGMNPSTVPITWPTLPLIAVISAAIALTPMLTAPEPPRDAR